MTLGITGDQDLKKHYKIDPDFQKSPFLRKNTKKQQRHFHDNVIFMHVAPIYHKCVFVNLDKKTVKFLRAPSAREI